MEKINVTQQKTREIITSGNPELDSRMGGGIPAGSLVLIEGGSGSGKSVLSQQIIHGALFGGYRVSLFTSENTVRSLVSQMASIDLDVLDFLLMRRLRVYPVEFSHTGVRGPELLLDALQQEEKSNILIIDSFSSLIAANDDTLSIFRFFEEAKRLCDSGKTILVTLHPAEKTADSLERLRSMCDAHLVLNSERDGQRVVKTLKVAKVRGAVSVTGAIVGFEVEPGWGMRVIPISKARG